LLVILAGCVTQPVADWRSQYAVEFGVISNPDPDIRPWVIDRPTTNIEWIAGVNEPVYGAQLRKFSADTYNVYFEVYRDEGDEKKLLGTSPKWKGFGQDYDCDGCSGTLLRYSKGKALLDGTYFYTIYVDDKLFKEIEFQFMNR